MMSFYVGAMKDMLYTKTFVKYGIVGTITALIYVVVTWVLYSVAKFVYAVDVTAAYVVSTAFHFLANRNFTFADSAGTYGRQIPRYMVLWTTNYLLTILVAFACVTWLKLPVYVGVAASVFCTVVVGFILARLWVFVGGEERS